MQNDTTQEPRPQSPTLEDQAKAVTSLCAANPDKLLLDRELDLKQELRDGAHDHHLAETLALLAAIMRVRLHHTGDSERDHRIMELELEAIVHETLAQEWRAALLRM